jgi:phosphoglycerate dehydrogenase-like enzyme
VDILLLESLIPEAMAWLEARHSLAYRPALADDERALRHSTERVRAVLVPNQVIVNQDFLDFAPSLEVVARLQIGTDNIDLETCRERGIKVVQARSANVRANAEFLVGALLMLYRQGMLSALAPKPAPVAPSQTADVQTVRPMHPPLGREINGSTIGLLGMGPASTALAGLLSGMGARLIGYDPALHFSSPIWQQTRVQPVSLPDMMATADAVSVQMMYASRFRGFVNARVLAACKRNQIWVSISRNALFDTQAMVDALQDGRIGAWLSDSAEEIQGEALASLQKQPNFYATERVGSSTREARQRASWYLAHRLHDILSPDNQFDEDAVGRSMALGLPGDQTPSSWIDSAPPPIAPALAPVFGSTPATAAPAVAGVSA